MKINVLGTEYTIQFKKRYKDKRLDEMDGLCDYSVKKIILACFERETYSQEDLEAIRKKVLRHEIIHAFLCESGLSCNSDWAENDELVDWIALQGPKIYKVWQEAGAI